MYVNLSIKQAKKELIKYNYYFNKLLEDQKAGFMRCDSPLYSRVSLRSQIKKYLQNKSLEISSLLENLPVVIWKMTDRGDLVFISPNVEKIFGFTPEEFYVQSLWFKKIHPHDIKRVKMHYELLYNLKSSFNIEYRVQKKGGEWLCISDKVINIYKENDILYFEGIYEDITLRKKQEKEADGKLKERELLLKEVHHRVKNHLQIISSVLAIQSYKIKDKEIQNVLSDCQNKISIMANIHESLYHSGELTKIDFSLYIKKLVNSLLHCFKEPGKSIKFNLNIEETLMDINSAVSCGIIINELIVNSLKYAFPHRQEGEINLSFYTKDGKYNLIFSDNGSGFSEETLLHNDNSFGLQLVAASVEKLRGTMELECNEGTKFEIRFKIDDKLNKSFLSFQKTRKKVSPSIDIYCPL